MLLFSIIGPYRGEIKVRKEQRRDNCPIYDDLMDGKLLSASINNIQLSEKVVAHY